MPVEKYPRYLFIVLLVICCSCSDKIVDPDKPQWTLDDAYAIAGQNANLKCLIVYKENQIIKEKYFHPGDSSFPHDVRSVTKSVMATVIGIAIDKGIFSSEDQTIGDDLRPSVPAIDSVKAHITIRNLLCMSSGISGNDLASVQEYNNWFNAPNQLIYTLSKPMDYQPGQTFEYNSGASHLLSAVLTHVAEMSTYQFAQQYLFQPLGIADRSWGTDKQGITNGAAALTLTPYDMLKIGQLYLQKGMYNGVRVVSEEWITKTSTFKITTNGIQPFGSGYGYLWWIGSTSSHGYFFANGYGGQFIVVVPDLNLIVVATNRWSGVPVETANAQWYSTLSVIVDKIIPLYE